MKATQRRSTDSLTGWIRDNAVARQNTHYIEANALLHLLHTSISFVQENGNGDLIQLSEPGDHLDARIELLHRNDGVVLGIREGRSEDELTRHHVSEIRVV